MAQQIQNTLSKEELILVEEHRAQNKKDEVLSGNTPLVDRVMECFNEYKENGNRSVNARKMADLIQAITGIELDVYSNCIFQKSKK
jgi:hypothetical protein